MDSSPFPDPTPSSSSSSFPHGKPARFDARALLFDESMEEEPSMAGTSVLGSSDDGAGRFPPSSGPRRRSSSRGSHKGKEREREADSVGHDDKLENRLASLHVNGDEAPADGAETEKDDANRPESAEEQEERRQQRRNDALTRERDGLAYMNTILEKALEGFERAVPGVEVGHYAARMAGRPDRMLSLLILILIAHVQRLSKTIGTTHELLDTYVKVLSQAQHTQSLLLDPEWEVAKVCLKAYTTALPRASHLIYCSPG